MSLRFHKKTIVSQLVEPSGRAIERQIEVRVNPVTGRTARVAISRAMEGEPETAQLPQAPPGASASYACPFCDANLARQTPRLPKALAVGERLQFESSRLFPNLYPYGRYSAVSLFDNQHFVEIGKASALSYYNSICNCRQYLAAVEKADPEARYVAITQNHLPSAGGSLIHPHLQVHADAHATNHMRRLVKTSRFYHERHGRYLFSAYLRYEKQNRQRYIGSCGNWEWVAAFAPEGFFELWAILTGQTSIAALSEEDCAALAEGICRAQKFYRRLNRNGYNLGLLAMEAADSPLELRLVMLVRSNYAPWVRNDHTGFEVMLGDMTTFSSPEETANQARPFWP
jgi:galactose-1-phosphate uridylyltransferase